MMGIKLCSKSSDCVCQYNSSASSRIAHHFLILSAGTTCTGIWQAFRDNYCMCASCRWLLLIILLGCSVIVMTNSEATKSLFIWRDLILNRSWRMSLIVHFLAMKQWTPVILKEWFSDFRNFPMKYAPNFFFASVFYFKNVASFNTQYKEAPLAMLWKIIIKENNIHIFEVHM